MLLTIRTIDHPRQHRTPWHVHESGQLYWVKQGIMIVETSQAQWAVTPGTLGWFPANLCHRAHFPVALQASGLYLGPSTSDLFPPVAGLYGADSFVQALLERLCRPIRPSMSDRYQKNLLTVLAEEVAFLPSLPLQLMLPLDRRARNVADHLLAYPDCALSQSQLAQQWGLSVRTLSRLFQEQTGLSFSRWRQQAKLVKSLSQVLAGVPVSQVAYGSGYNNVSAYIAAFRERFGMTPRQFRNKVGQIFFKS